MRHAEIRSQGRYARLDLDSNNLVQAGLISNLRLAGAPQLQDVRLGQIRHLNPLCSGTQSLICLPALIVRGPTMPHPNDLELDRHQDQRTAQPLGLDPKVGRAARAMDRSSPGGIAFSRLGRGIGADASPGARIGMRDPAPAIPGIEDPLLGEVIAGVSRASVNCRPFWVR